MSTGVEPHVTKRNLWRVDKGGLALIIVVLVNRGGYFEMKLRIKELIKTPYYLSPSP
jgi:hypothetical protein